MSRSGNPIDFQSLKTPPQEKEIVLELEQFVGVLGSEIKAALNTGDDSEVIPDVLHDVQSLVERGSAALANAWRVGSASKVGSAALLPVAPSTTNHLESAAGATGSSDAVYSSVPLTAASLLCNAVQSTELSEDGVEYLAQIDGSIAGSIAAKVDELCFTDVIANIGITVTSAATNAHGISESEVYEAIEPLRLPSNAEPKIFGNWSSLAVLKGLFRSDRPLGLETVPVSGDVLGWGTGQTAIVVASLPHCLAVAANPFEIRSVEEAAGVNVASGQSIRVGRQRVSYGAFAPSPFITSSRIVLA